MTSLYSSNAEHETETEAAAFVNTLQTESGRADLIKVSAKSRSTAVAGAFAEVQAIGAGAVNQAVKALAIAHGYLTGDGIDIVCTPFFTEVDIDGQERTAVRFSVELRPPAQ